MPTQLTFFGVWDAVVAQPEPPLPEPEATALPASDPRQCSLFDGPLTLIYALEEACRQLAIDSLCAAWHEAEQRLPAWARLQPWPRWCEDLAWLLGQNAEARAPSHLAVRALSLTSQGAERFRFVGMAPGLLADIRQAALMRAAFGLVELEGPGARLADGHPAGWLLLYAERPADAAVLLERAVAIQPQDGRLRGYLGEALWRAQRPGEALATYRDACLLAPETIEEAEVSCRPVLDLCDRAIELELPGPALAWVPVLADLGGLLSLATTAIPLVVAGEPYHAAAAHLCTYRQLQRAGALAAAERLALKRALIHEAPALRELVRRL